MITPTLEMERKRKEGRIDSTRGFSHSNSVVDEAKQSKEEKTGMVCNERSLALKAATAQMKCKKIWTKFTRNNQHENCTYEPLASSW